MDSREINALSPLALAYLGDSVYETAVRKYLLSTGDKSSKEYNKAAVKLVCAVSQSEGAHFIEPMLSEEEADAMRRGRNTHAAVPKSATVSQYRAATGLEALMGKLYLEGKYDRITELCGIIINSILKENKANDIDL